MKQNGNILMSKRFLSNTQMIRQALSPPHPLPRRRAQSTAMSRHSNNSKLYFVLRLIFVVFFFTPYPLQQLGVSLSSQTTDLGTDSRTDRAEVACFASILDLRSKKPDVTLHAQCYVNNAW